MKNFLLLPLLAALVLGAVSCGKQQTDAERQAEIDRQVQQRLDAEHQADAQKNLDQRQAELDARERALADKENQPASTPVPNETPEPTAARAVAPNDQEESGSYATFYRRLDPYGDWIETVTYGYVFQPRPAARSNDWRPYTNGHWVYTEVGWTWISDEPFGWATYHYGRWTRLRDVGWVWVPGDEWAPAWVSWRRGNNFVGWAPLPPQARFNRSSGLRISSDSTYGIAPEQYAFVPTSEFGGPQSSRVIVPPARNVTIINQTTNVTNITVNNSTVVDRGPSYDDLRARSHQQIPRLRLERTQNLNDEKPVIRGDVVALPAPNIRPAKQGARPARVQRKIAQPVEEQTEKPSTPIAIATPTAVPIPTARRRASTPIQTPSPTPTPTPTKAATPTPAAAATPTPAPSLNPREQKRQEHLKAMRAERRKEREQTKTDESLSPSPSASITETPLPGKGHKTPNQP